jgi:lysophospholipase L1-like esterase
MSTQRRGRSRRGLATLFVAGLLLAGTPLVAGAAPESAGPTPSGRYVALGDSVPYGHGLANPYGRPEVGLPPDAVDQGPSTAAYPSLVAQHFGLSLSVRPSACPLSGDQLSISGAEASAANAGPGPPTACGAGGAGESVPSSELPETALRDRPELVTIQAGADDVGFARCLTLALLPAADLGRADRCVADGQVTATVQTELHNLTAGLASVLSSLRAARVPHVAVVDYYQPIPRPSDFDALRVTADGHIDPVCALLGIHEAGAYSDAVVLQTALDAAIESATGGRPGVTFVEEASLFEGHGMCTRQPYVFSGEPLDLAAWTELWQDVERGNVAAIENVLETHAWRVAHPNASGQAQIATAIESALGPQL